MADDDEVERRVIERPLLPATWRASRPRSSASATRPYDGASHHKQATRLSRANERRLRRMSSVSSISPVRLPDVASIEAVLARLDPVSVDADTISALAAVFPGFDFSLGLVNDHYRRDSRSVIRPDGTRVGELREWMMGERAKDGGNINALWSRLKENDLQTTVWCGTSAFAFAPTGPGASDYIQIAL